MRRSASPRRASSSVTAARRALGGRDASAERTAAARAITPSIPDASQRWAGVSSVGRVGRPGNRSGQTVDRRSACSVSPDARLSADERTVTSGRGGTARAVEVEVGRPPRGEHEAGLGAFDRFAHRLDVGPRRLHRRDRDVDRRLGNASRCGDEPAPPGLRPEADRPVDDQPAPRGRECGNHDRVRVPQFDRRAVEAFEPHVDRRLLVDPQRRLGAGHALRVEADAARARRGHHVNRLARVPHGSARPAEDEAEPIRAEREKNGHV